MKRRSSSPRDAQPPMPDAQPCVWMAAGLVAWKLCDRNFECQDCELDIALRGHADRPARAIDARRVAARDFPADRRYHRSHVWAAEIDEARVRIGLDAFAASLLDRMTSIVLPVAGSRIEQHRVACWAVDDAKIIPLCAPVSGTVQATNDGVQDDPQLVAASPYDRGWLVEVACDGPLEAVKSLRTAEVLRERSDDQMRQLDRAARARLAPDAIVGATMADGGVRLSDLRKVLGAERYHRLVLRFLR